jgi:hypothetical protein
MYHPLNIVRRNLDCPRTCAGAVHLRGCLGADDIVKCLAGPAGGSAPEIPTGKDILEAGPGEARYIGAGTKEDFRCA